MSRARSSAIAAALALALAGTAAADSAARRKGAPDKFAKAAGEAFVQAVEADKSGDLKAALGLYQKAYAISPHPSTVYNIADVQRRLLQYGEALKSYETYLALAPSAGDRKDVEALIDKLSKTPGTLHLVTAAASDPNAIDLKSAYVLVAGELKLRPGGTPQPLAEWGGQVGFTIPMPAGTYVVDVVTPITHGHQTCRVEVGGKGHCRVTAKPRIDGRLVVNASERQLTVRLEPKERGSITGSRLELPPGKRKLLVRDRSFECPAIPVTLPAGGDVQYVFVSTAEHGFERCRSLDVKLQRLTFAP